MKRLSPGREVGLDILTLGVLFIFLLPILWVFVASVRPDSDIVSGGPIPLRMTIQHYQEIIAFPDFLAALKNSLIVGVTVAVITTAMAVPAAYALSRLRFKGRNAIALIILGTQMLPSVAVLVPLVVIIRQIGLSNTLTALIFTHLALGMPIAIWILRGYIDSVPRELEEAALIDGARTKRLQLTAELTLPGYRQEGKPRVRHQNQ
jgi:ABC-type glycerol-3-phosphate transport system permease component